MNLEQLRRFALACDDAATQADSRDLADECFSLAREARRRAAVRAMDRMISQNGRHA